MGSLWIGGEDICFPNGAAGNYYSSGGAYRTDYARCSIYAPSWETGLMKSTTFPGGAITSGWIGCRLYVSVGSAGAINGIIGLGLSGTNKGIFIGIDASNPPKLTLAKWDGSTLTVLATATATMSFNAIHKIDLNLITYSASGRIVVYCDATSVIDYSGDVTISGVSNFDSVFLSNTAAANWGNEKAHISEIVVADADTRTGSVVTHASNGAGDGNSWTGGYTDIDELLVNDVDQIYDNVVDHDFQCALSDCPSGSFSVKGLMIFARAQKTADATPTKLKIGIKSDGAVNVDAGSSLTNLTWETKARLMAVNPITGTAWNTDLLNALQLDLRAGS